MGPEVDVSLILPTYNERECLRLLHRRIDAALARYRHEVIVVDDDSPDGTAEEVRKLAAVGPYRLLARPGRRGLSSAVLDGIRMAAGSVVAVMDADGSHPPELLPSLVTPVLEGKVEFALGSRRVPGGSDEGLSPVRRLTSELATWPARVLAPVHDPMSGFFAVRRAVLARGSLAPTGFKIGLEILAKCRPHPVVEVPYRFSPRLAGESKLAPVEILAYVRHLTRLYRARLGADGRASSTR